MNRRGFFAVLAALPFVGKLIPKGQSFECDASRYLKPLPKPKPYHSVVRTGLPKVQWRKLNEGVSPPKL